jgi:chemotaxis protein MotB
MARKKKHPEHVNHERWLVSYADFITLLFAFFVVMFAVSQVDTKKVGRFTESFQQAVGLTVLPNGGAGLLANDKAAEEKANLEAGKGGKGKGDLQGLREALETAMKSDPALRQLEIIQRRDELVLRLSEAVAFGSGDYQPKAVALSVLQTVAEKVKGLEVDVRVEGHTDDRPIKSSQWKSNWMLSTGRSVAVLDVLISAGVDPTRLSAAGYGEFHPIASNATAEGRARNRRVDLVVIPHTKVVAEEAPVEPETTSESDEDDDDDPAGSDAPADPAAAPSASVPGVLANPANSANHADHDHGAKAPETHHP